MRHWELPKYYMGEHWDGWLVFLGQNRDSDILTRSNFRVAVRELTKIAPENEDNWLIVRESHWACGWVEWIAIKDVPENNACIIAAEKMENAIADYPILDEEDYSQLEDEECQLTWDNCYNLREKIELVVKCGLSKFAARSECYPYECAEYLR